MNTTFRWLISLLLAFIPIAADAQTNIKSAFDAIINCRDAQITETHELDKDPSTKVKTGQCDVYKFVLPSDKIYLVKNVVNAINKDSEMSYGIKNGICGKKDSSVSIAVGDGSGRGVAISSPEYEYAYALFLAPQSEDPEGIYRYAYGINFKMEGNKIVGKLVVTYATTLKYRQEQQKKKKYDLLNSYSGGSYFISSDSSQNTWFEKFMSYIQAMSTASSRTRISYATKLYRLIQDVSTYPEVTDSEKQTAREILKGMVTESKYSETILNKLLQQCITAL